MSGNRLRNSLMVLLVPVLYGLVSWIGGTAISDSKAVNAMEDLGYTQVTITDRTAFLAAFRGCGISDDVKFTVIAVNPKGKTEEVDVCANMTRKQGVVIDH